MTTIEQIRQEAPMLVARAMRAGLIRMPDPEPVEEKPKRTPTQAREERIAAGLCGLGCGAKLAPGYSNCEACRAKEAARVRGRREARK